MVYEIELLALGRILLGGYFAFAGLNHFMSAENMSGWVSSKGLPAPEMLVYFSGGQLLLSGLGIALGALPVVSAISILAFLVVASLLLHDFWNMEGEQRQQQMTHFLKNIGLIGGILVFAGHAGIQGELAYSVGLTLQALL